MSSKSKFKLVVYKHRSTSLLCAEIPNVRIACRLIFVDRNNIIKINILLSGTFVQELIDAREFYKNRIEKTYGPVKAAMQKASRQIYKCDPIVYRKGNN